MAGGELANSKTNLLRGAYFNSVEGSAHNGVVGGSSPPAPTTMKLSELSDKQKHHLVWRLDRKTACGLLSAAAIARMEHGDHDLVDVFRYYTTSLHSAKIHARKVINFKP